MDILRRFFPNLYLAMARVSILIRRLNIRLGWMLHPVSV
ncbi:hypothetical protein J2Z26_000779 [Bacillus luteolus]|nr:hypothetical protein [Cytobacillus luteolus]